MPDDERQSGEVTRLLGALHSNVDGASSELLTLVYQELRTLARVMFQGQSSSHTLQPTALVHEAWLKLAKNLEPINSRRHFFAVAAMAMRQVLADYARAARREKRGGAQTTIVLRDQDVLAGPSRLDLLEFDDALTQLSRLHERHARVAELRLLGSLSIEEIASELGVSTTTVDRDWKTARAWLKRELR